jgi:antitoxin (DNA-binding transcriptional repressor) of toxin-antitoxin stability system
MVEISARELQNDVHAALRRVQAGERLQITVGGRLVAELAPLHARPTTIGWETFLSGSEGWRADASLAKDLAELVPDTTDDITVR